MLAILLLIFFAFSFLFRTDFSFDQDLGRHIKLGEIIVKTHQVPKINLFSYTNPNFPFVNTHWLFEVIAYLFTQANLLNILLGLKIIIFLVATFLTLKIFTKQQSLLLILGFIFLHAVRERLELRPEIFSFFFTSLTLYILEKKIESKFIWLLPLIQLIWVNTHIYFFVGLVIQGIFITQLFYEKIYYKQSFNKFKNLLIIFCLSIFVSLVNPNGVVGFLYPLNVNQNYGYTIVENQTMFFLESIHFSDPNFLFVKICLGVIALSLLSVVIRRKVVIKDILLCLFGVVLALMNVRSFPYLFFLSFPSTLHNFPIDFLNKKFNKTLFIFSLFAGFILIFESGYYLSGQYYKQRDSEYQVGLDLKSSVKGAMDFVISRDLPGPIFNNFDIGSYIIYKGYPKYKVFVDGRPEAYPAEFFTNTYIPMQYDYKKFQQEEGIYKFQTIIFSHTDQTPWAQVFIKNVLQDSKWKLVYLDNFMLVLTTDKVAKQMNLPIIDLSKITPDGFNFDNHVQYLRLGLFLINYGFPNSGKLFVERALQVYPQSPLGNAILGSATPF